MTPTELREARRKLGLSAERLAKLLGVASGRTVRRWEAGDSPIPGPVVIVIDLLLTLPAVRDRLVR